VFDTKAPEGSTGMTWIRRRAQNLAEFHLDGSSGKALSAKHAYHAKLRDLKV